MRAILFNLVVLSVVLVGVNNSLENLRADYHELQQTRLEAITNYTEAL